MPGLFESLARGAGQGASLDFGDELSAKLLAALPKPSDPEGTERNYAAGSPEADYVSKFRRDNAAAAEAHPLAYGAGAVAGSAPLAALVPGGVGGSAAARIAASGLTGGALGAVSGAGAADGRPMADQAARGAALGGLLGAGGSALSEAAPAVISAFRNLPPPGGPQLAPAMAGGAAQLPAAVGKSMAKLPGNVSAAAQGGVREAISGTGLAPKEAQLTYSVDRPAMPPKSGTSQSAMPKIPNENHGMPSQAEADVLEKIGDKYDPLDAAIKLDKSVPENDVREYRSLLDEFKATRRGKKTPENDIGAKPPAEEPAGMKTPVTRFARKKAPAAGEPPQQLELDLPQPEYSYHATPQSNAESIAELGLRPEQGQKNFKFEKNKNTIFLSPEKHADEWAQKLADFSGEEPLRLRTSLRSEAVPGANERVRMRSEAVPPEFLQRRTPSGHWRAVKTLLDPERAKRK